MKKSLLATVAAVALIAGTGIASAEGMKDQPRAGGAEMHAPAATQAPAAAHKAEPEMKRGADIKADAETKSKAAERKGGKAETTGAGEASEMKADSKMKAEPKADSKMKSESGAPAAKSSADEKAGAASKSSAGEKSNSSAQSTTSSSGKAASLTPEQKTKIRTTVLQSGPKVSRTSINFNINVGTVVPRSVHFVTVPQTIVEIYPEYRGFDYFVVDEEIVILDPHSLKIVAILNV